MAENRHIECYIANEQKFEAPQKQFSGIKLFLACRVNVSYYVASRNSRSKGRFRSDCNWRTGLVLFVIVLK